MLIAMLVGMVALGGAIEGALALAGGSLADASASLAAVVMAVNMTVPMIWWMRYRGHPARHNVEWIVRTVVRSRRTAPPSTGSIETGVQSV
jgi:hypothetical protein